MRETVATSWDKARAAFGKRLSELRQQAGFVYGKDFAQHIGWNAPKVSKLENGRQTASQDDLDTWLAAVRASPEVAAELHRQLRDLHEQYVTWKQRVKAGHLDRQLESAQLEANAKVIRAFDVGVVPGLLQTPDYARAVLLAHANVHGGGKDITEAVRARMRRQQILWEPGKTIEMLMTQSALQHPVGPPDVMAGQVDRLVSAIGTPNVRFGILPAGIRLPYMPIHGYWIIDNIVLVETVTGELTVSDPDEVATYNEVTDLLWEVAAEGAAARRLLTGTDS
jgi:transcriptional regulator with XRE-family HTH domain